jgi:hypothetical protein
MSWQHYTQEEEKEKLVGDSSSLCYGHRSTTRKKLTETVLAPLWKATQQHWKRLYVPLEQQPRKQTKQNIIKWASLAYV